MNIKKFPPVFLLCCVHVYYVASVESSSATLWTAACQAPLSMGFARPKILEWVPVPSSRDRACISYVYLHWQVGSLPLAPPWKPSIMLTLGFKSVGEFQKAKKHALPNTNVGINDCLLEESSPKLSRQSPGDQRKDLLRYVF